MNKMFESSEEVLELANGDREDRYDIDDSDIRLETIRVMKEIEDLSKLAYSLTFLEAKLHCDEYHETKSSFKEMGEKYGYINSYVRQESGSNTMRFQMKTPLNSKTNLIDRQNIRMPANGYTATSFKNASHELEFNLCIETEKNYQRLRQQGKVFKQLSRSLRTTTLYKNGIAKK